MPAVDWSQSPPLKASLERQVVPGYCAVRACRSPSFLKIWKRAANIDDIMDWFERLDRGKAVIEFVARSLDQTPSSAVSR